MLLHYNNSLAFDKERDGWEKKCKVLNAQVAKLRSANKNSLSRAQSDALRASVQRRNALQRQRASLQSLQVQRQRQRQEQGRDKQQKSNMTVNLEKWVELGRAGERNKTESAAKAEHRTRANQRAKQAKHQADKARAAARAREKTAEQE
eukprot:1447105-Rhodomonas_salina.1